MSQETKYIHKVLLIGCNPYEERVLRFERESGFSVYTLDIDYIGERHFKCNFNHLPDIYNFYTRAKSVLFDQVIFDRNVMKFFENEYKFQALLIVLNNILNTGGKLFFECCTEGN